MQAHFGWQHDVFLAGERSTSGSRAAACGRSYRSAFSAPASAPTIAPNTVPPPAPIAVLFPGPFPASSNSLVCTG
jgi:hypothetical protein